MRIGLLSYEYPPETGFGGIGTYTWYQARALVKLGHEVVVLAGATEPTPLRRTEHDGVIVYRYRSSGWLMRRFERLGRKELWWTKSNLENALSMYEGLKKVRKEHALDIVEMPECGSTGSLINRLTRTPALIKFHSPAPLIMSFYPVNERDFRWCSRVEAQGMRGAKYLTSCSSFLAREVKERLAVRRHVEVVPNGIDLELFDAGDVIDARERFQIPGDRLMIFFAGRMEPRKGIHVLKDFIPKLLAKHDVSVVLAGQDNIDYMKNEFLPAVEAQATRGSLHYVGKLDLAEVRSCLRQADMFLIPSLWENAPYSCLEAMASGRAIVSSDCGGLPELIQDGENGLLAKTEDAESFHAAVERLIEDSDTRHRLGAAARRTVEERYTDLGIAKQSVAYYEKCVGT